MIESSSVNTKINIQKIISQFTRQPFPIFCTLSYKLQKPHHTYGPLHIYGRIRYKWSCRINKTYTLRIYVKPIFTKNKHEWLHMLKLYTSHTPYLHIIYDGFPWMHTYWTCCPVITVILYFILVSCDHKVLLYAYVSDSHLASIFHISIFTTPLTRSYLLLHYL